MAFEENTKALLRQPDPSIMLLSATRSDQSRAYDVIVTDPPYYDAIPYSDLMDFFYVWLRRSLRGQSPGLDAAFSEPLSPKWITAGMMENSLMTVRVLAAAKPFQTEL
jgi:adenine-specific DNA methylase